MWSVCRQRTGCVCTSAGRIVSRTDCVDTGTCCASAFSTTIDTSRAGCPIGLRRARCPTAGTNCSTILVAALAFIVPNFTAVKAMLGFQPTNPLVVTFDAINSLSTLRSTKYELRTHSSTDDSLDARMSGMYSLGQNHQ